MGNWEHFTEFRGKIGDFGVKFDKERSREGVLKVGHGLVIVNLDDWKGRKRAGEDQETLFTWRRINKLCGELGGFGPS